MTDPENVLAGLVRAALAAELGDQYADADPLIRPSQFADYQSNVALPLAKAVGQRPRELAAAVAARLADESGAGPVAAAEMSGPGFVNITLRDSWLAQAATSQLADLRLGVALAEPAQRVVVDYSGPNVAKELHAGHLRPTVVGDSIVRVLEHLGHTVIRAAHLGDWGTQFGMLIEHALDIGEQATAKQLETGEFTAFYQAARTKFDAEPSFADAICPAPGEDAVLVANPADRTIYYYKQGMSAPQGSFSTNGRTPRGVLTVDRSLQERMKGIYETHARLGPPGDFNLAFLLDIPRITHFFDVKVNPDPERSKAAAVGVAVTLVDGAPTAIARQPALVQFRLTDRKTNDPTVGLTDVTVLAFSPGGWQRRYSAKANGRGVYAVEVTPPRPGPYYLYLEAPSAGVALNHHWFLTLEAKEARH